MYLGAVRHLWKKVIDVANRFVKKVTMSHVRMLEPLSMSHVRTRVLCVKIVKIA